MTRRLSQRLQFRGNYTWAKNLDMNSALTIAQAQNQPQMVMDRNDVRRDWGPSALTPKHQGTISVHYELPFSSTTPGALHKLIGGWQANGITTLLSGFPLDISIIKNTSLTERVGLQFRAEAFNALNHTNFGPPNSIVFSGTAISPSAGLITATATTSRQIQFGLKLLY